MGENVGLTLFTETFTMFGTVDDVCKLVLIGVVAEAAVEDDGDDDDVLETEDDEDDEDEDGELDDKDFNELFVFVFEVLPLLLNEYSEW